MKENEFEINFSGLYPEVRIRSVENIWEEWDEWDDILKKREKEKKQLIRKEKIKRLFNENERKNI